MIKKLVASRRKIIQCKKGEFLCCKFAAISATFRSFSAVIGGLGKFFFFFPSSSPEAPLVRFVVLFLSLSLSFVVLALPGKAKRQLRQDGVKMKPRNWSKTVTKRKDKLGAQNMLGAG